VRGTVAVIGGFMLLWMGYGMIKDASSISLDLKNENENISRSKWLNNPVLAGMVVSLSNPYWLIWWATIGLTLFASLSHNAVPIIIAFYLGHISGDALWYLAVGGAVATGRRFINPGVYKTIIRVCAVILILLGFSFLYLTASGNLWKIKMDMAPLKHKIESISVR
jgi:threonine/homoserine/homoserine lactone efflux protein